MRFLANLGCAVLFVAGGIFFLTMRKTGDVADIYNRYLGWLLIVGGGLSLLGGLLKLWLSRVEERPKTTEQERNSEP